MTDVGRAVQPAQVQKTSSQPSMVAHAGVPTFRRPTWKDHELVPGQSGLYNKILPQSVCVGGKRHVNFCLSMFLSGKILV